MKLLLVGAGGYAANYVKALLKNTDPDVRWVGVVDPYFEMSKVKDLVVEAGIPVYDDMEAFFEKDSADLVMIATPPFLHGQQSRIALSHGASVLCEKPICPTVTEAEEMLAWEKESGRFLAIGYQWSYSDAIGALKKDILSGVLGRPVSMKTMISWPRTHTYYGRGGGWGGRVEKDGVVILDSIASNACAHYLHNMLFLLGDRMETAASPETLEAWLRRANEIETFDTCAIRMGMKDGTELLFVASHAAKERLDPVFVYTFENAEVRYDEGTEGAEIVAYFKDGSTRSYGCPKKKNFKKIWDCVEAVRSGTRPICTVATAMEHTRVIDRLHKECEIQSFDRASVIEDAEGDRVYVEGLYEVLLGIYESGELPQ
ncbi:MAG: Gfo/Idh/MocA family oxidoreductase [Clostridia bacterium]|nr:Gfo/Idh/MocA family oxidoreductase [Clostridia bacterium]